MVRSSSVMMHAKNQRDKEERNQTISYQETKKLSNSSIKELK